MTPPILAYHATTAQEDFLRFEYTEDVGFHFGTREAANTRIEHLLRYNNPEELMDARVLICHLHVRNPLRLWDCHTWSTGNVLAALHSCGVIDDAQHDELAAGGYLDHPMFRDLLEARGYDSVIYTNETEGGGDSYIVLRPEHIRFALCEPPSPRPTGGRRPKP